VSGGEQFRGRIARPLARLGVSPNLLTASSFVCGAGAGAAFAFDRIFVAWILVVLSGFLDMIDGRVAELSGRTSRFGAILDSTLDRYAEFALFGGLVWRFRSGGTAILAALALTGSIMVSYTRARAEGLGIECKVGFMQRAERMILLVAGSLVGVLFKVFDPAMIIVLAVIAIISNLTAIERTLLVKKIENRRKTNKEV